MADPQFHCPECHQDTPYYETRKGRDPRSTKFRIICGECIERIKGPVASDFRVEANFRKAGPSAQAAAAAADSASLNRIHRAIWAALREKPRTADEIATDLKLVLNTARARITDLHNAGWIKDSGDRRETDAKRMATVWETVTERVAA